VTQASRLAGHKLPNFGNSEIKRPISERRDETGKFGYIKGTIPVTQGSFVDKLCLPTPFDFK
jgi:hypothetical protein